MMKKVKLIILLLIIKSTVVTGQNAFTIHNDVDDPVHIYYDRDTIPSHIIYSIYPQERVKQMSKTERLAWQNCGYPLYGAYITVRSRVEGDCFYVTIGDYMDSVGGYVKKENIAVLCKRHYKDEVLFHMEGTSNSTTFYARPERKYFQILDKRGDWYYVQYTDDGEIQNAWIEIDQTTVYF